LRQDNRSVRAAIVFLAFAGTFVGSQRPIGPRDLDGPWDLETVAGKPANSINIQTWRITFSASQQWTYFGEMTERFGGMRLSGSGTWKIVSGELEYTAGENKGRSNVMIKNGVLTLSPDPVVMPDGKTPAVTTYKRGT
jgi:hypothetical protein